MSKVKIKVPSTVGGAIAVFVFIFAALITSIVNCLFHLNEIPKLMLLVIDILLPFVGIIHGIGLWFGADW